MKIFITIVLAVFFFGCSKTSYVFVNEKYDRNVFRSKSIFIVPVTKDVINITDTKIFKDGFDDDERSPEVIISEIANKSITKRTGQMILGIKFFEPDSISLHELSKSFPKNYLSINKKIDDSTFYNFKIPKKEILESNNIKTDFALVINYIDFDILDLSPGSKIVAGASINTLSGNVGQRDHYDYSGSSFSISAKVYFIIYDYSANEIVSYGITNVGSGFTFGIKETYRQVIDQIAGKVFKSSNFKWHY